MNRMRTDQRLSVTCAVKPFTADEQTGLATGSGRQREAVPQGAEARWGALHVCGWSRPGRAGRPVARGLLSLCPGSAEHIPSPPATARDDAAVRGSAFPGEASAARCDLAVRRADLGSGDARALSPAPRAHPHWSWPSE